MTATLCFHSGIPSFTMGTTWSRRRSLCTTTQSPTSPACDQQRPLSHISIDPGSHTRTTPQSGWKRVAAFRPRELKLLMLLKLEPWWGQARDASGFKVQPKLILRSGWVAGTWWTGTKPVLCLSDTVSVMLVLPSVGPQSLSCPSLTESEPECDCGWSLSVKFSPSYGEPAASAECVGEFGMWLMTGSHGRQLCCQSYLIMHTEDLFLIIIWSSLLFSSTKEER